MSGRDRGLGFNAPGCEFTMAKEQDLDYILLHNLVQESRVSPDWHDF